MRKLILVAVLLAACSTTPTPADKLVGDECQQLVAENNDLVERIDAVVADIDEAGVLLSAPADLTARYDDLTAQLTTVQERMAAACE